MSKPLDFNKVKKKYLTVTLSDENNTTLMVTTPTKAIMDDLIATQSTIENVADNGDMTGELYDVCAKVLSRNKGGVKITKEYLESVFDFEDITIFLNAYMNFITEVVSGKN